VRDGELVERLAHVCEERQRLTDEIAYLDGFLRTQALQGRRHRTCGGVVSIAKASSEEQNHTPPLALKKLKTSKKAAPVSLLA
jgi:hypothetical protein